LSTFHYIPNKFFEPDLPIILIFPAPKTRALGGVATKMEKDEISPKTCYTHQECRKIDEPGNMKAKEQEMVAGSVRYNGWSFSSRDCNENTFTVNTDAQVVLCIGMDVLMRIRD
jgi:hypothetical protein